tara:strand:- start:360 stop:530 length:171 start_codon:yes stop_codon:yes gene_type:complete
MAKIVALIVIVIAQMSLCIWTMMEVWDLPFPSFGPMLLGAIGMVALAVALKLITED